MSSNIKMHRLDVSGLLVQCQPVSYLKNKVPKRRVMKLGLTK